MFRQIDHVALHDFDIDRSIAFYERHVSCETGDFDSAVADIKVAGIRCVQEPHDTDAREQRERGWRRMVFAGPDGEAIELHG